MFAPCLLALMLAGPQQPVDTNWENPSGVVRDEKGKPIEGATVSMRWLRGRGVFYGKAIEQILAAAPLPRARTAADGTYSLALTREHHLLGCGDQETFVFVVEKPGYQRWVEPLPHGIRAHKGSQVTLLELGEADELRFLVRDHEPGMRLLVRRSLRAHQACYDVDPGELVLVPPDGMVAVRLPLAPSPPQVPEPATWCLLGIDARVLLPGRSSDPQACYPGRLNVISAPRVERAAVRAASQWRGLYRCPNGEEVWFAQANAAPEPDEHLRFVRAERDGEPSSPPSAGGNPRAVGDLKIVVLDDQEHPIPGASVCIGSLVDSGTAPRGGPALRTDAQGVTIARQLLRTTYHVLAIAPGFAPSEKFAVSDSECTVILAPVNSAVLDQDGDRPWRTHLQPPQQQDGVRSGAASPRAEVASRRSVLVALPPDTTVGACTFRIDGRSGASAQRPDARGSLGILLSALPLADDRLVFTLGDGSGLVVDDAAVARAPVRGPWLACSDERGPARVVGLTVRNSNGLVATDVMVVPVSEVTLLPLVGRPERQLARSAPGGTWVVRLRAAKELRCLVLHPDHVPVEITIPPTEGAGLEVSLPHGSPLTVRRNTGLAFRRWKVEDAFLRRASLEVVGHSVVFEAELPRLVPGVPGAKGPDVLEFRAPFALPPGKHQISCGSRSVTILAELGRPAVANIE